MPVAVAERLVADSYASITISDQTYRDLAAKVDAAFDKRMAGRNQEIVDLWQTEPDWKMRATSYWPRTSPTPSTSPP